MAHNDPRDKYEGMALIKQLQGMLCFADQPEYYLSVKAGRHTIYQSYLRCHPVADVLHTYCTCTMNNDLWAKRVHQQAAAATWACKLSPDAAKKWCSPTPDILPIVQYKVKATFHYYETRQG